MRSVLGGAGQRAVDTREDGVDTALCAGPAGHLWTLGGACRPDTR